jgi:hypothetical protein
MYFHNGQKKINDEEAQKAKKEEANEIYPQVYKMNK